MRAYTLALLSKLTPDCRKIEDKDIVEWVNGKVSLSITVRTLHRGAVA